MKPDPKDQKKLWKKATCLEEVAPRSYEVDVKGTRHRRNGKDLIATQESPEIDSHVGESDFKCNYFLSVVKFPMTGKEQMLFHFTRKEPKTR